MRRVQVMLVVGALCTAAALMIVLSRSPPVVAGTNGIEASSSASAPGGTTLCQGGGTLPADTSAIRVSLLANLGPRVKLTVLSGTTVITGGTRDAGWGVDASVTVPVKPLPRAVRNVRVCTTLGPAVEKIQFNGSRVRVTANGKVARTLWLRAEYLRPGNRSWLSLAASVAQRMGLGRAGSGTWIVYLAIALMVAVAILASRLILWELR